jgi:hypothetical protein
MSILGEASIGLTDWFAANGSRKVVCTSVNQQPTYYDFFVYANRELKNTHVLLANTDIVFDDSLGLIDLEAIATGAMGFAFSVVSPPYAGDYKKTFGSECTAIPRCAVGDYAGFAGGMSWDAYLFYSPTRSMDQSHLNHVMNTMGGENRAGYQLEVVAGVKLVNPCMHVHAFHWHCIGGDMHHTSVRADADYQNLGGLLPCWDCPGIKYLEEHTPGSSLCQLGDLRTPEYQELKDLFLHDPGQVQVCFADKSARMEEGRRPRGGKGYNPVKARELRFVSKWASDRSAVGICKHAWETDCFIVNHGAPSSHHTYR